MKTGLLPFVLGIPALLLSFNLKADDGESAYTDLGCVYCHGPAGKEPALPVYPKLAGQNVDYLVQQALDIQSLDRSNGYTGMMQPAVVNVSEDQFTQIAEYLATVRREPGDKTAPEGKTLYLEKGCAGCHGQAAEKPVLSLYPKLAGQNKDYLVDQILQIKNGERSNGSSAAMSALVATLSDAEVHRIAEYLSEL